VWVGLHSCTVAPYVRAGDDQSPSYPPGTIHVGVQVRACDGHATRTLATRFDELKAQGSRLKALLYDHTSYYLISHTILVHSKRSGGADETSVVESVDGDGDNSTVRYRVRVRD
jgi:hypothetical protein